jgi:PDZ domain-containing protein
MAHDRGLTVGVLVLALAGTAAATPCEEGRGQTGLGLAVGTGGELTVGAIDVDSIAAASGVRVGDGIVQVNGAVPRTCSDYARAVRDARSGRKALLLLVRRGEAEVPLVVGASSWERAVANPAPPPVAEPPTVRRLVAAAPPPPLPPETSVTVEEVTHGLAALGTDHPSARLETYREALLHVHRQVETLAARGAVPGDVLEGLRTVLGYHDAAAVAWTSEETQREREGRPRHVPTREGATAPYFEDSDVAAAIDQFPFLRDTVAREPAHGLVVGESAGLWRPQQARAMLWDRGREELARLTAWLSSSSR